MHAEIVRLGLHQVDIKIVNQDSHACAAMAAQSALGRGPCWMASARPTHPASWGVKKSMVLSLAPTPNGQGGTQVMLLLDPSTE